MREIAEAAFSVTNHVKLNNRTVIMPTYIDPIADYANALRYTDLSANAIRHVKRCLIDTFGVALGAFDEEPCKIARALAQRVSVPTGARILGTPHRTLPELAAFANSTMARYFDGNDVYPGGGGHPSDMMGGILAVALVKFR